MFYRSCNRALASVLAFSLVLSIFTSCSAKKDVQTGSVKAADKAEYESIISKIKKGAEMFDKLENGTLEVEKIVARDKSPEDLSVLPSLDGGYTGSTRFSTKDGKLRSIETRKFSNPAENSANNSARKIIDGKAYTSENGGNWAELNGSGYNDTAPSSLAGIYIPKADYISEIKSTEKDGNTIYTISMNQAYLDYINEVFSKAGLKTVRKECSFVYTFDRSELITAVQSQSYQSDSYTGTYNGMIYTDDFTESEINRNVLVKYNSADFEDIT